MYLVINYLFEVVYKYVRKNCQYLEEEKKPKDKGLNSFASEVGNRESAPIMTFYPVISY